MINKDRDISAQARGKMMVISAPSGTGKDTVISQVLQLREGVLLSISATTRPPRQGEENGKAYFFVTKERFGDMISADEFLEYAEYVGEFYGTPKKPVYDAIESGMDVIIEVEVKGAKQIMDAHPEALTVFIAPPSMEELENRLRGRKTDSEQKLLERLEVARYELGQKGLYKHTVINDEVLRAADEIISLLDA